MGDWRTVTGVVVSAALSWAVQHYAVAEPHTLDRQDATNVAVEYMARELAECREG